MIGSGKKHGAIAGRQQLRPVGVEVVIVQQRLDRSGGVHSSGDHPRRIKRGEVRLGEITDGGSCGRAD
jgi:hypothetical protein